MQLKVPLVLQETGSVDCGLADLAMLLQYYGYDDALDDLKQDIEVDATGTYAPQLGSYLLQRGFHVEIVTAHPKLFTRNDKGMSSDAIIERFRAFRQESKDEQNRRTLGHFIDYLERGGTIRIEVPNTQHISEEIEEKRPVCALATTNFLRGDQPGFNFHFQVVTGIDEQYVYVNDPLPDARGGKQKFAIGEFFYGLFASVLGDLDNGCLIRVKK